MYENIVLPVQNLRKTNDIKPGGLCRIFFFKKDDVLAWPQKSPQDGVIYDPIQLKEGSVFYTFQPADKERFFNEDSKQSSGGPYVDVLVNGRLAGNTLNHITSLDAMLHFEYGLIIVERTGEKRLIGSADRGADISFSYTSGDADSSRISAIKFNYQFPQRMPIYVSDMIIVDDEVIPIGSGTPVTPGSALNELVPVSNEATKTIQWTTARKQRFGNAAVFNVYLIDEYGNLSSVTVSIKPDSLSNPSKYDFDFGGVSTGIIIIS